MKSLFKTFYRSVRDSLTRFISIFLISFLGVGFFAGINTVKPVMIDSAQSYFDQKNLSDITILTPLELDEQEIIALRSLPEVKDVNSSRFADAFFKAGDQNAPVRFFSIPPKRSDALDQLSLMEGEMPQNPREILMDASVKEIGAETLEIGKTFKVFEPFAEETGRNLAYDTYKIVGFAHSPQYLTYERDATTLGSGRIQANIYALPEAFLGQKINQVRVRFNNLEQVAFNSELYDDRVTEHQETLQDFGEEVYAQKTQDIRDRIEASQDLFETEKAKGEDLLDEANAKIEQAKRKLNNAQKELDAGVEEGKQKLEQAEKDLEDARDELEEGEAKQRQGELELAQGEAEYNAAGIELAMGRAEISRAYQALELSRKGINRIADLIDQNLLKREQLNLDRAWLEQVLQGLPAPVDQNYLDNLAAVVELYSSLGAKSIRALDPDSVATPHILMGIIENTLSLMDLLASQWDAAVDRLSPTYEKALADYNKAKAEYDGGLATYQEGAAAYRAAGQKLMQGRLQVRDGARKILDGKLAIRDGEAEIEKGYEELESKTEENQALIDQGWQELKNSEGELATERDLAAKKIKNAERQIEDAKRQLGEIPKTWFVYRRSDIPGFSGYANDAERIGAVGKIFPLFFFLVAALVTLTTMTRMVEEERQFMGTLRSLGYGYFLTAFKYLAYAFAATVSGSIIGGYFGLWVLPSVITWAYNILYTIPTFNLQFESVFMTGAVILQIVLTLVITVIALVRALRERPAQLMQPKAPKPGKRILLERIKPIWNHLGFSAKLTARNLFRYKSRSTMTVLGVAGCSALLLAGFGIGNSVNDILRLQVNDVWNFDMLATYSVTEDASETRKQLQSYLDDSVLDIEVSKLVSAPARVQLPEGKLTAASWMNFATDAESESTDPFIVLRKRIGHEPIPLEDEGVVVTEKLSEIAKLKVGDTLTWLDIDGREYSQPVIGITENYTDHYIYMSDEAYTKMTHRKFEPNVWLLRAKNRDMDEEEFDAAFEDLSHQFAQNDNVLRVALMEEVSDQIAKMLEPIGLVVVVIVAAAGLLLFVVLYNLISINVAERVREIATVKVLGFYNLEVSRYIFSEVYVLTVLGSILGLFLGVILHIYIVLTVETDAIMFGRTIHTWSYFVSLVLTLVFTTFVAIVMHFRLQKIDMVDSLKSVE